jgi:capsular polysaccharide biosynthesis protein
MDAWGCAAPPHRPIARKERWRVDDDLVSSALLGRLLRRRWAVLITLAALGALLGAGASQLLSPGYESASKVLAQGARDSKQMLSETEVATSLVVLDRAATALGWGQTGADLRRHVTATVGNGNVVEIRGTADTAERAQQLTDRITSEYIAFSTQVGQNASDAAEKAAQRSRDLVQQRIDDANQKIAQLQASPPADPQTAAGQLQQLQQTVADATKQLDTIGTQAQSEQLTASLDQANMTVIEPAVLPGGQASPTLLQLIGAGAAAMLALGVFGHLVALRTDRRLRRDSEVAAALGAPVLGTVEVAHPPVARSLPGRIGSLFHDDRRWALDGVPAPGDGPDGVLFYHRVLTRLRHLRGAQAGLLAVLPAGDPVARRAAALLATAAAADRADLVIVADGDGMWEALADATAGADGPGPIVVASTDPAPPPNRPVLRIVEVPTTRPVLPEVDRGSTTVLVLTAGTLTGWDVAAITDACAIAGSTPVGAILAVPVRVSARAEAPSATDDPDPDGPESGPTGPDSSPSDKTAVSA